MEKLLTFPGLGLELHLNPILWSVTDSFGIHWYGVIIAAGFLLAAFWCCRQAGRFGISKDHLIDMLFFAVPLAIVGARLYYVIFQFQELYHIPGDFWETLRRIVRIWDGGLAVYGGIIAGVLTLLVFCKVRKINFLAFADLGCMGLLIGQCVGRWGNFVNVEAFGSVTGVPWRMAGTSVANYLLNSGQVDAAAYRQIVDGTLGVHPTFFYESLWNLIGFLLLALLLQKRRKFDGQMFFSYIAWYGAGRFFIEGLRTDSIGVGSLRISQLLAAVSALAAIGAIVYILAVKKPEPAGLYVNRIGALKAEEQEAQEPKTEEPNQVIKEEPEDGEDTGREGPGGQDQGESGEGG